MSGIKWNLAHEEAFDRMHRMIADHPVVFSQIGGRNFWQRPGQPADLVGRHEQRGEPAVDECDVCVQRAGAARDARGGRSHYALLLHGLCAAVHDGERVRAANAEHPRPVGHDRGGQAV